VHRFRSSGWCIFSPFILIFSLLLSIAALRAQEKPPSAQNLKIGFLMDSLKIERWQTDLDRFQKRAHELGADVLIETAEGDDELQLQQARKLINAGVKSLVLVPHDAEKAVRIVAEAKPGKYHCFVMNAWYAIRTSVFLLAWTLRPSGSCRPHL
jgi:ABC-type xylose transport system substrate-binding protein